MAELKTILRTRVLEVWDDGAIHLREGDAHDDPGHIGIEWPQAYQRPRAATSHGSRHLQAGF